MPKIRKVHPKLVEKFLEVVSKPKCGPRSRADYPTSADYRLLRVWEQAHDLDFERDGIVEMESFAMAMKLPLEKCLECLDETLQENLVGFFTRWRECINRLR